MKSKQLIIGLLAVAVIAGAGFFVMNKKDKTTNSSDTQTSTHDETNSDGHHHEDSKVVDDACKVFSGADFGSAFGITVGDGDGTGYTKQTNADGLPNVQCEWKEGEGGLNEFTFVLGVENYATVDRAKQEINDSKIDVGNLTWEQLSGIADDAILTRGGSINEKVVSSAIYWLDDKTVYHLSATKLGGFDRTDVETKLKTVVDSKF